MTNCIYQNMRFLIVDNVKPSQDILKQFVMSLANTQVDSSHYAQDVITICRQKTYDVILLGYDLGDNQKNGQQILEELRVNKYINRQCVVMLITAEISQSMVLAALEHKPDHYICKPYSLNDLDKRLTFCLKKKKAMTSIYQALDDNKCELVIKHCKDALKIKTPYKTECLGIISRQYFDMGLYDEARTIYQNYYKNKNCLWATIGLGKLALHEKKLDNAEKLFKLLIKKYPLYLTSYDWLAETYEAKYHYLLAEDILEKALALSPRSLSRLKKYAHLCMVNEHFDKATEAYRKNYKLAYNSIHHCAENALKYVQALIEHAPTLPIVEAKKESVRAFTCMKQMLRDFSGSEIKIQSHLLSACLHRITKENKLAKDQLDLGQILLSKDRENIPPESLIGIAKYLRKLDKHQLASQILLSSEQLTPNENENEITVDDSKIDKAQTAIKLSISLYEQKYYQEAIQKLREASESFPRHSGIKLNLVQAILVSYEQGNRELLELRNAKELIAEMSAVKLTKIEQKRLKKLQKKYQQMAGI